MAILRIVHIIFAVFVAGYYFFMVPILMPKMKKLGPAIQGPLMQALMSVLTPVMWTSVIVIVGTGVAMALVQRQGALDTLFSTGSGWAMIIGFVLTVAAATIGFGFITPAGLQTQKLGRSIQGRPPTPEEAQQLGRLSTRIENLSVINFVLVVIILLDMLIARYV
ncbi:MAG: hypothetical protein HY667_05295 [Chloroflexi bacterium]|nr:hypothetical protein [Chloroflexota bacterium]